MPRKKAEPSTTSVNGTVGAEVTIEVPVIEKPVKKEAKKAEPVIVTDITTPYSGTLNYEAVQRFARSISMWQGIAEEFQGGSPQAISNIMMLWDTCNSLGVSVSTMIRSAYFVHGKMGFASSFYIGRFNTCGKWFPMKPHFSRDSRGNVVGCYMTARLKETGEEYEGIEVTLSMAQREGWTKSSKWANMPQLMLQYRASVLFIRTFAPEVIQSLHSVEELEDASVNVPVPKNNFQTLNESVAEPLTVEAEPVVNSYRDSVSDLNALVQ